ncbi:hypothetical protein AMS59_13755 [Lysinibacillus sp. FJAT-14745]|nr:hypothetical protein AMS59_13755 [Lysinibacillus sp. FJAT-14745]
MVQITTIKAITKQEINLLHAFKSCGVMLHEYILSYISNHRLSIFIRDGLIKKASTFLHGNSNFFIYFLSAKGKRLALKVGISGQWYRSASVSHDIEVLKKYMSLPLEARLTWQTEKELQIVLYQTLQSYEQLKDYEKVEEITGLIEDKKISATDGAYESNGKLQLFEVITRNYTFEDILAKLLFTDALNCQIEMRYTR